MPAIGKYRCPPIWVLWMTVALVILSGSAGAAAGPQTDMIAEVNGAPITRRSFQVDYRHAVNAHARKGNPVNEAYLRDLRKRLIDYLVETELLFQDARARGIHVSDKELDQAITAGPEAVRQRNPVPGLPPGKGYEPDGIPGKAPEGSCY